MSAQNTFNKFFNAVNETVEFDPSWKNGTGYLDGICRQENLVKPGQVVKTIDDHGRKVLIAGTKQGAVAVFERYIDDENGVIVCNFPWEIDREKSELGSSNLQGVYMRRMFIINSSGITCNTIDDIAVMRD